MSNIPERCVIIETRVPQRMPVDNGTRGFQIPISGEETASTLNRIRDNKKPVICRRCNRCNPLTILIGGNGEPYELVIIPTGVST